MSSRLQRIALTGNAYLNSYQPLRYNSVGRRALAQQVTLQPYEDASCRREPDFLHPLAPITGVCRGPKFVTRLRQGDVAVYMTKRLDGGHYITAVLEVKRALVDKDAHEQLADLSVELGHALPGNCLVKGNGPLPLSHTGGFRGQSRATHAALHRDSADELTTIIRAWDGIYRKRIKVTPNVAVTTAHFVELTNPPFITNEMLIEAFGRIPGTLNPTNLGLERINYLLSLAGVPTVE
jgi:hypothetical protein